MYKYFTAANTLKCVDNLSKLMYQYDHTYHRSIHMTPAKVTMFNPKFGTICMASMWISRKNLLPFKWGIRWDWIQNLDLFKKDTCPVGMKKCLWYAKSYRVWPPAIKCKNSTLQGTFYAWDLQKVQLDESSYSRVEKVLKRQKDKLYVKWRGYPAKYNSWIHKKRFKVTCVLVLDTPSW